MSLRIGITGIGTGVGKTLVSAVLAESLGATYWKPVQAGYEEGTDRETVMQLTGARVDTLPELYKLKLPASPHIAAREEGMEISLTRIEQAYQEFSHLRTPLIMEAAGGLLVPLNNRETCMDLFRLLQMPVVLVSRHYLGSINHSLLTAQACRVAGLKVLGWVFTDEFMDYEDEIVHWSGYQKLFTLPHLDQVNASVVRTLAARLSPQIFTEAGLC